MDGAKRERYDGGEGFSGRARAVLLAAMAFLFRGSGMFRASAAMHCSSWST